jgi:hypothetical protein
MAFFSNRTLCLVVTPVQLERWAASFQCASDALAETFGDPLSYALWMH